MKQIPLTQGKFAIVDDEDYEYLNQWKWCVLAKRYAVRVVSSRGNQKMIYMHRVIMNIDDSKMTVDHINHDGFDNRKINLRLCSQRQNNFNKIKQKNTISKYKGVTKHRNSWIAQISIDDNNTGLGVYENEKDAALAYDRAAEKHFGEFANLNFPNEKTIPIRKKLPSTNTTGLLGVYRHKNRYKASITSNKKQIHLGLFSTKIEAAIAYNEGAIRFHGVRAKLNTI